IAAANWTRPCVTSLLTGKYPDKHRMINVAQTNNVNLYPQENLPAILKKDGYALIALSTSNIAQPIANGTSAFFDVNKFDARASANIPYYELVPMLLACNGSILSGKCGIRSLLWLADWSKELFAAFPEKLLLMKPYTRPFYPPELVFNRAKDILGDANNFQRKPLFLWTHLQVPHAPYLPASPAKGKFSNGNGDVFYDYAFQRPYYASEYAPDEQSYIDRLRLHYDENIFYGDEAFGQYLRALKQSGRFDDSIIIVSADHGESFNHGFQGHGGALLYQPLVHIPLLIHLPGQEKGRRLASTVSQTDIAPTILDLLGYAVPAWMDGRSLKEAMGGKQLADRPVFSMNLDGIPIRGNIAKGNAAVISGGYKYVIYGKLYDLKNDPEEKNNLADLEPERMQTMHQMILDRIAGSSANFTSSRQKMDY
ncbi:MAG TPA: sulfatase-like hydrolase/transferase, partial [Dongiaceae bacterium]|nr:sulfatase-like hydrolase/transferase [Dongiaceae bacterium]